MRVCWCWVRRFADIQEEEKAKACGQVRLGADVVEERSLRRDGWVVRAAVRERRLRSDAIRAGVRNGAARRY